MQKEAKVNEEIMSVRSSLQHTNEINALNMTYLSGAALLGWVLPAIWNVIKRQDECVSVCVSGLAGLCVCPSLRGFRTGG